MKTTIAEKKVKFKPCKRILGADLISGHSFFLFLAIFSLQEAIYV